MRVVNVDLKKRDGVISLSKQMLHYSKGPQMNHEGCCGTEMNHEDELHTK